MQQQPITKKTNHRHPRTFHIPKPSPNPKNTHHSNRYSPLHHNPQQQQQLSNTHIKPTLSNHSSYGIILKNKPNIKFHDNHHHDLNTRSRIDVNYNEQQSNQQNQYNGYEMQGNKVLQYNGRYVETCQLPQLQKLRKNQTQVTSEIGHIRKQQQVLRNTRYSHLYTPQTQRKQLINSLQSSNQKSHNQLALSLLGIKRTKMNKSCLDKRNSMMELERDINRDMAEFNTNKINRYHNNHTSNQRWKQSQSVEIYKHSYYPYRADDINHIKQQIQHLVKDKWQIRKTNYDYYQNKKYKHNGHHQSKQLLHQDKSKNKVKKRQEVNSEFDSDSEQFQARQLYKQLQSPPVNVGKVIRIDHKTSLSYLKSYMAIDEHVLNNKLHIQVPDFFVHPPKQFGKLGQGEQIDNANFHSQASYIFSGLGIPVENLTVRKYSNCVVIINMKRSQGSPKKQKVAGKIQCRHHGKRYFGGWRNKYFDQGVKQGMGLQWAPNRYIYYGQFQNNKRNGFGLMKTADHQLIGGFWKNGKNVHFGIEKNIC